MKVYGIDFTSAPKKTKPVAVAECTLALNTLTVERINALHDFQAFEGLLDSTGPWIAGIDFPFGQSRRFLENMNWPMQWKPYVNERVAPLERHEWSDLLDSYKLARPAGDREHLRLTDKRNGSKSPQKQYGVPVGKMFFEGAPRLSSAGVHILGLHEEGDCSRWVVEAYPGVAVRALVGNIQYKAERTTNRTSAHRDVRATVLDLLINGAAAERYAITLRIKEELRNAIVNDGKGDALDAVLCAVQVSWAWYNKENPALLDVLDNAEGWIADPSSLT